MSPVTRTERAASDLADILEYLDQHSPPAAERFAAAVDQRCAQLGRLPDIGRLREELAPGLRSIVIDRYVLFYRVTPNAVEVLRILHGARDLERIMKEESSQ
jgi:toxin ParE1/3/4